MRHLLTALFGPAAFVLAASPPAVAAPPALALTRANVLDGVSARPLRNVTLLIEAGRIRAILPSGSRVRGDRRVIDLNGAWVLPGLIDAHVHLRDEESAKRALWAGVTTARSLGVDRFIDVKLARRHAAGAADLPEIIGAGYHVRPILADAFFADFPALARLKAGVTDDDAAREAVRANASSGVAWIKVMATQRAGTADTDFRQRALSDSQLSTATVEAKRHNLPVAAHAHTDDGVRGAVLAGVRTVEHGTAISPTTLRLMRARRACLVPTLSFWADMAAPGGEYDDPALAARGRQMLPIAMHTVRQARQAGVIIIAGSDMRYDRTSPLNIADELMLMRQSGLDAYQVVRAATSLAALCLGVGDRTGSIRTGMEADLVIVGENPTRDFTVLKRPLMVINDGVLVRP
ncbi:MAG TPA: amidohydrolase family protein [Sphingomicrobium sp.]|nr:amidohydrolase family protein [Sphingomicrobium sp.]